MPIPASPSAQPAATRGTAPRWSLFATATATGLTTLLAACTTPPSQPAGPVLACDDGLKAAFKPDALTTVVAVRSVRQGEALTAVDSPAPVTAATDLCLVKLLVGPGTTAEKDKTARSYSEGIGIEVWLPTPTAWNARIRNYGGGGWVGGGHRTPGQIGSKVPAIVNANLGYAVGTTDAGQPWSQDGSFIFLSNGQVNAEGLRDFSVRAMVEQATKTRALVQLYYGRAPQFAYYDGHSQGGRQGLKIAQEHPELYDGYMIAQPALSIPQFGPTAMYAQLVMKAELGYTAADKPRAAAFAKKVEAANARAVAQCDAAGLGYLLDPFACSYNPARDAGALCAGVAGDGVTGAGSDAATCMSRPEADALNRIWYGATRDGRFDAQQTADARSGLALGPQQLWWTFTRGTAISGLITSAGTDNLALALQDVRYAADASLTRAAPIVNTSTAERNRWMDLDYAGLGRAVDLGVALQPSIGHLGTDQADLRQLRDAGRKIVMYTGLADDAIPPATSIHYYQRVQAGMGGVAEVQKFFRMYMVPGMAHSSQGRAYTVGGKNNSVPMPQLPGNANQRPQPEQDPLFSALVAWVEQGQAPGELQIRSRDGSVGYPICVYPQKTTWNGQQPATLASNYRCQ